MANGALFQICVERLAVRQGLLCGEDRLGIPCGKFLAVFGGTGLYEQRMALWGARHIQRPGH